MQLLTRTFKNLRKRVKLVGRWKSDIEENSPQIYSGTSLRSPQIKGFPGKVGSTKTVHNLRAAGPVMSFGKFWAQPSIRAAMKKSDIESVMLLLDDFLLISSSKAWGVAAETNLIRMCQILGGILSSCKGWKTCYLPRIRRHSWRFSGYGNISEGGVVHWQGMRAGKETLEELQIVTGYWILVPRMWSRGCFPCIVWAVWALGSGILGINIDITCEAMVGAECVTWLESLEQFNGKAFFRADTCLSNE